MFGVHLSLFARRCGATPIATAAALMVSGMVHAVPVLDQSVVINGSIGDVVLFDTASGEIETAQTFTAGLAGTLSQVGVQLWKDAGALGDVNFTLRRTLPDGTPSADPLDALFSSVIPNASLPQIGVGIVPFTTVDVSGAGLTVNPGDTFAISLERFGVFDPGVQWRRGTTAYSDGDNFSRFGEGNWQGGGGTDDLGFRTWVDTGPPAPGLANGDYETGDLTGWTAFSTPNGSVSPGLPDVFLFDTDGDGQTSSAAKFQVGIDEFDANNIVPEGGGIRQSFTSEVTGQYVFTADVASINEDFTGNTGPGRFDLILDGNVLDTVDFTGTLISPGEILRDSLFGVVDDLAPGEHTLELAVTRTATNTREIFQYIDNVEAAFVLCGDYDGDGSVSQGDLDLVLLSWGQNTAVTGVPAGWINNAPDGVIGQESLDKVLLNWGAAGPPGFGVIPGPLDPPGTPLPEPATAVLLFLVGARRRR